MFGFLTDTLTVYQGKWAKTAKLILDVVFWEDYHVERQNKRLGLKAESECSVLYLFVLVDPFDFSGLCL